MAIGIEADLRDQIAQAAPRRNPEVQETLDMIRSYGLVRINDDLTVDEILGYRPNGYCE